MLVTKKIKRKTKGSPWLQHSLYALLYVLSLVVLGSMTSCSDNAGLPEDNNCGTKATVKNLTGLDGCGYVLELENGQKLEPILDAPSATPSIKGVSLRDGMRVTIAYRVLEDRVSICMVGKVVEITCLKQEDQSDAE